jgi:hypothetical protein
LRDCGGKKVIFERDHQDSSATFCPKQSTSSGDFYFADPKQLTRLSAVGILAIIIPLLVLFWREASSVT